jgi:hypothetical protein
MNATRRIKKAAASIGKPPRQTESGVALLMTIFGLLLLTGVIMAMLYASDSETMISVNYRDKQTASYAAMSGLQEARERIQPVFGDLATNGLLPTKTPDGGGYVLYIINPKPGEVVQPWNPANAYFDQELCQEGMLGLVGQRGVACQGAAAVPSTNCSAVGGAGGGWCQYYDNSAHATAWNLANPLDYKWVRISLKEDWNTPVYVTDATLTATGKQVCWDGNYQAPIPAGYSTKCQATGGNIVTGVNVLTGGSGYTSAPAVSITGGGGSGATATAQIGPGPADGITSVTLTNGGSGYTAMPIISIVPAGATFQAVIASAPVTGVTVNPAGSNYCYSGTPAVNFATSPLSNNASGTVNMTSSGCISNLSASGSCSNVTAGQSYPFTGSLPGGSGFAGSITFGNNKKVNGATISSVGSGYSSGSSAINIVNDKGSACSVTATYTTGSQIQSVTVTSGGAYMSQPSVTLGGTNPSAPSAFVLPTLTALPNPWPSTASAIQAINITSPGSGYTPGQNYTLTITPSNGQGSGATAYGTASGSFIVNGFNVTNGGSGYTSAPNVTLTGGGGTGATASATIAAGSVNTSMGAVYMLTSMAATKTGAKTMSQMEVGIRPPFSLNIGGAITLAGIEPSTTCSASVNISCLFPNSSNFAVSGFDANSCAGTAAATKPAIGVYDNQSQLNIIGAIPGNRQNNYTGAAGIPSVEDVYTAIGGASATPAAMNAYVQNLASYATASYSGNVTSLPATTMSSVTYINGDLTLSGNASGSGVLIVTGNMTFQGNFTWNGVVLVIGQGSITHSGGGNGIFNGAVYVAKTNDPTGNPLPALGTPTYLWNGGGTNQINYDHCKADALLQKYNGNPSDSPLQILSTRMLQF